MLIVVLGDERTGEVVEEDLGGFLSRNPFRRIH